MALTKEQKDKVVAEVTDLLNTSKMTVICEYQGMSVAQAQELRRSAIENGSSVKVVKNRLLRHAASQIDTLKELDLSGHAGQLMYIFNPEDEVAAAKLASEFAKKNPELKLKAAFSNEGVLIDEAGARALAALPNRKEMLAMLINTLKAPARDVVSGLSGGSNGIGGLVKALESKASN
jgi:large subunit ribosomal protein L10